jgi:hypothetical protein
MQISALAGGCVLLVHLVMRADVDKDNGVRFEDKNETRRLSKRGVVTISLMQS